MKPILNIADASADHALTHDDCFAVTLAPLAEKLGAKAIGSNLTTIPPGRAAFPYHHHYANEEHFFVVRGTGLLRFGFQTHPIKSGDYFYAPPGGPEVAHQFLNDGTEDLAILAFSSQIIPEVVGYPDSHKTGVRAMPFGAPGLQRFIVQDGQRDFEDYWGGEDGEAFRSLLGR